MFIIFGAHYYTEWNRMGWNNSGEMLFHGTQLEQIEMYSYVHAHFRNDSYHKSMAPQAVLTYSLDAPSSVAANLHKLHR